MDDPRPLLFHAADQVGALITGPDVPLGAATPCDGWTVEDLLAHLVAVHTRIVHVGRGGDLAGIATSEPRGSLADYRDALAAGGDEVREVWTDDAVLDRMLTPPWGRVPGRAAGWGYVQELTVHGWDLAAALGATDRLDPALAEPVAAFSPTILPAEPRGGPIPFGPPVPVADDAGPYERLVGWLGRDPATGR